MPKGVFQPSSPTVLTARGCISLRQAYPEILEGTSGTYMNWETVDPEKWVPEGYAIVKVDSRGTGRSEGVIDSCSDREAQDFCDCIEHVAQLPWCDGKVAGLGISYYAIMLWAVAAKRPPHYPLRRRVGLLPRVRAPWRHRP